MKESVIEGEAPLLVWTGSQGSKNRAVWWIKETDGQTWQEVTSDKWDKTKRLASGFEHGGRKGSGVSTGLGNFQALINEAENKST